jgi:hypothetical protein
MKSNVRKISPYLASKATSNAPNLGALTAAVQIGLLAALQSPAQAALFPPVVTVADLEGSHGLSSLPKP